MDNQAKLSPDQVQAVQDALDGLVYDFEFPLLRKYNVLYITEINAKDFDSVMKDFEDWYTIEEHCTP